MEECDGVHLAEVSMYVDRRRILVYKT
jgi:hypothetical protein